MWMQFEMMRLIGGLSLEKLKYLRKQNPEKMNSDDFCKRNCRTVFTTRPTNIKRLNAFRDRFDYQELNVIVGKFF